MTGYHHPLADKIQGYISQVKIEREGQNRMIQNLFGIRPTTITNFLLIAEHALTLVCVSILPTEAGKLKAKRF